METVEKIDSDVEALHSELDRHDGKRSFHCNKRCRYILGIAGLFLLMFLFGALARPTPKQVVVSEVAAVLDMKAPRVVQPKLDEHISALFQASKGESVTVSTHTSTATAPRILTWTPASVGKSNPDGTPVPLVGSYEVPAGYYGIIRLTADGADIGSTAVDARTLTTPSQGRFTIIPTPIVGEKTIRISFDAVKSCRIACAPDDQLCIATNVNYCTPLYDNQSFASYFPVRIAQELPEGSCVQRTFVAFPDKEAGDEKKYTSCNYFGTVSQVHAYLAHPGSDTALNMEAYAKTSTAISSDIIRATVEKVTHLSGSDNATTWSVAHTPGDAETKVSCNLEVTIRESCDEKETPVSQGVEVAPSMTGVPMAPIMPTTEEELMQLPFKFQSLRGDGAVSALSWAKTFLKGLSVPNPLSVENAYAATGQTACNFMACQVLFGICINGWEVQTGSVAACGVRLGELSTFYSNSGWVQPFFVNFTAAVESFDGACGTANGVTTASQPTGTGPMGPYAVNPPPNAACASGWFTDTADTGTTWEWQCAGNPAGIPGIPPGVPMNCSAPKPAAMCGAQCMGDASVSACIIANAAIDPFPPADGFCGICGGAFAPCGGGGTYGACGTPTGSWTWASTIIPDGTFVCAASAVNGACGTANGTTVASTPSSNLCSAGTASTISGAGPWSWTCGGTNGGSTASCNASKSVATGGCWANDGATCTALASNPLFPTCSPPGAFGDLYYRGACEVVCASNPGSPCVNVTTFAGGFTLDGATCTACAVPVNGSCGTAKGTTVATAPSSNLCSAGAVSGFSGSGPWTWSCLGSGGGTPDPSCFASLAAPILTINATDSVNFGSVPVDPSRTLSSTQSFTITNSGTAPFNGTITFFDNGTHDEYDCSASGGNSVSVTPGTPVVKTCTLTTTLQDTLGGTASIGNDPTYPAYTKHFTVIATALSNSQLDVARTGYPTIVASPYAMPLGTLPPTASPVERDFEIRNSGSSVMNYSVSIIPAAAPGYTLSGECGGTINALNILDVCKVTFNPSVPGAGNATIRFDNLSVPNVPLDPIDVTFTATVQVGSIGGVSAQPGPASPVDGSSGVDFVVTFPAQTIGSSINQVVGVTNAGDVAITGPCTDYVGANFTVTGCGGGLNVPPGIPQLFTITFTPQAVVILDEVFTISANANNLPGGDITIIMKGSGIAVPTLTVSVPMNHDFGSQDITVGPASPWVFTITNTGSVLSNVTLSVVPTGSTNPGEFTVGPTTQTILDNGTPYNFTVNFNPDTPGSRTANILITPDNAPQQIVSVWGEGINTPAGIVPDSPLDFGRVIVGKTKSITVGITNNDSLSRSFGATTLTVLGGPAGTFTCTAGCGAQTFPFGTTRQVTIAFTPTVVADYPVSSGIVLFFDNDPEPAIDNIALPITGKAVRPLIQYKEN